MYSVREFEIDDVDYLHIFDEDDNVVLAQIDDDIKPLLTYTYKCDIILNDNVIGHFTQRDDKWVCILNPLVVPSMPEVVGNSTSEVEGLLDFEVIISKMLIEAGVV